MEHSDGMRAGRKVASSISLLLAIAVVAACDRSPTQAAARTLEFEAVQSGGAHNRSFGLTPPNGAPYGDAAGNGKIDGQFLNGEHPVFGAAQGLRLEVRGLPCRCYVGGSEAREFYTVYLSTTSTNVVRLLSFNTSFLSNVGSELVMPVPLNIPIFSEVVTVEVYLETDDGQNGPDGDGVLVLRGQVNPG